MKIMLYMFFDRNKQSEEIVYPVEALLSLTRLLISYLGSGWSEEYS